MDTPSPSTTPRLHPVRADRELADTFAEDVVRGLTAGRDAKAIPPKHLYDTRGCALFEQIIDLPEYYLPRTEAAIFADNLAAITGAMPRRTVLVEPGAGSGEKAARLLAALPDARAFVPIEISRTGLDGCVALIAERFPSLDVYPVCADFTTGLALADHVPEAGRALFFPGSTIGNLETLERARLLAVFADFLHDGGHFVLGYDRVKPLDVMLPAYDDSQGVTAAFDLNLLTRINRELDSTLDASAFHHEARWNEERERVEMHLVAERSLDAQVAGEAVRFEAGESIHTESSHKFRPEKLATEAAAHGFAEVATWTDAQDWYAVTLFRLAN